MILASCRLFSYVGPGHWLFLSTVSNLWCELYSALASLILPGRAFVDYKITCVPKMTLYTGSAVFASASRVRLAHDCSRNNSSARYLYAAGMYADIATLMAARAWRTVVPRQLARCSSCWFSVKVRVAAHATALPAACRYKQICCLERGHMHTTTA
jgi:hypothetical protein